MHALGHALGEHGMGHTRAAGKSCAGARARAAGQRDALALRTYERHVRDAHGARTPSGGGIRAHVADTEQFGGERAAVGLGEYRH